MMEVKVYKHTVEKQLWERKSRAEKKETGPSIKAPSLNQRTCAIQQIISQ